MKAFSLELAVVAWHCSFMHTVTLEEAKEQLAELVGQVTRGEVIVITQDEKPVARLAAPAHVWAEPSQSPPAPLIGFLKGKITLPEGWDEPLEEMRPYME